MQALIHPLVSGLQGHEHGRGKTRINNHLHFDITYRYECSGEDGKEERVGVGEHLMWCVVHWGSAQK